MSFYTSNIAKMQNLLLQQSVGKSESIFDV